MPTSTVPAIRSRELVPGQPRKSGKYVLYWMFAARRTSWNHALDRALELSQALDRPLVVLEALSCGYRWASARHHRFLLDGMRANRSAFERAGILHHAYVEPRAGDGGGLLEALAADACAVVADDSPAFFFPAMLAAAADRVRVSMEAIDTNGLLPLRATERVFRRAHDFRRALQNSLRPHLSRPPCAEPLRGLELRPAAPLPQPILARWPAATTGLLERSEGLADLPIDQEVRGVELEGGAPAASVRLTRFVDEGLMRYAEQRNHPDVDAQSGLSPYLHFGHVSSHAILDALARHESWSFEDAAGSGSGSRSGWWGMSEAAESFLDELVTWRELGLNFAAHRDDIDRYESLPDWALTTLREHEGDTRPVLYSPEELDRAETHDEIWNAAQRELVETGRMHNYLRMLWGKKILEWSPTPRDAWDVMIELNNRYALDGRDPNSYSGIGWVLGRYDRAWGPERPIFGKIRPMSSDNTRRKLRMTEYLERWSGARV